MVDQDRRLFLKGAGTVLATLATGIGVSKGLEVLLRPTVIDAEEKGVRWVDNDGDGIEEDLRAGDTDVKEGDYLKFGGIAWGVAYVSQGEEIMYGVTEYDVTVVGIHPAYKGGEDSYFRVAFKGDLRKRIVEGQRIEVYMQVNKINGNEYPGDFPNSITILTEDNLSPPENKGLSKIIGVAAGVGVGAALTKRYLLDPPSSNDAEEPLLAERLVETPSASESTRGATLAPSAEFEEDSWDNWN